MSELISGKEALIAWYDGKKIEIRHTSTGWHKFDNHNFGIDVFKSNEHQFRLARTITLNGIEVPTPNIITEDRGGYGDYYELDFGGFYYLYDSKKDYDAVVAALRTIFK